jgi:hypothetical protein
MFLVYAASLRLAVGRQLQGILPHYAHLRQPSRRLLRAIFADNVTIIIPFFLHWLICCKIHLSLGWNKAIIRAQLRLFHGRRALNLAGVLLGWMYGVMVGSACHPAVPSPRRRNVFALFLLLLYSKGKKLNQKVSPWSSSSPPPTTGQPPPPMNPSMPSQPGRWSVHLSPWPARPKRIDCKKR